MSAGREARALRRAIRVEARALLTSPGVTEIVLEASRVDQGKVDTLLTGAGVDSAQARLRCINVAAIALAAIERIDREGHE